MLRELKADKMTQGCGKIGRVLPELCGRTRRKIGGKY